MQLSSQWLKTPRYSVDISLPNKEILSFCDPKATRAMLALMNMEVVIRGAACHWGGPSAFLEIMIALLGLVFDRSNKLSNNWYDLYHIINDAGHCENALYAIKANYGYAGLSIKDLKKFRSLSSVLTGHGESHLFPEGVYLSNGPLGSTLSQAQGLCLSDYLKGHQRATISLISDGALMEGEAKEALATIAGWASKSLLNPFLLIVSDNQTKLSGRIKEDSFSMDPTLNSLELLGWKVVELNNPHHLPSVVDCLFRTLNQLSADQPTVLRARTIKGYGNQKTQESSSGGHGFPLKNPSELTEFLSEVYQNQSIPDEFLQWQKDMMKTFQRISLAHKEKTTIYQLKTQVGISQAMIEAKEQQLPVVSVSADLQGSTGVMPFRKKFPKHSFDVGVAEANMFSVASGLSKEGWIPVVDTFAQFGVTKGALPLFMASLSQAPVIAILSHIGFQDAADGASHQCLTYFAQTGSIPNTLVYSLSCSEEAQALLGQAIHSFKKEKKNYIFFIGRETYPSRYLPANSQYVLNQSQVIFSEIKNQTTKTLTMVATGTLLPQALIAAKELSKQGWGVILVHASAINQPDIATIQECLKKTKGNLLTIEDHYLKGGMNSFLIQQLSFQKIPFHVHSLGVQKGFGRSAYQAKDLYQQHGLDSASIVECVNKIFV